MLDIDIPGRTRLSLSHLVLDLNGTLAVDGVVVDEVYDRVRTLGELLHVALLTADTYGRAGELRERLGVEVAVLDSNGREAEQKERFVRSLGPESCAAVGNGANDVRMIKVAALGIGVLGREGMAGGVVAAADVVVFDPADALDLLLVPNRLVATLRR